MLLESQPDMTVTVQAADGREALDRLARSEVDVVLMDVRMPVVDGLEATRRLLAGDPTIPRVIMLTTFDLDEYVVAAIRAGASGFLLKDSRPEQLLDAVRTVHRGDAVIAPGLTRRLLDHVMPLLEAPAEVDSAAAARLSALTEREHQVFLLIAAARSNAEIAADLFLSEATVKTHVAHILTKLGARDRVQAVVMAYEAGVVGPGHPKG
ncbi:DNA-binding response regulator [Amnibacterium flavum]|uniref:DNA-binding response regulator n=2 Tax=Amnibacterium flavum TaxID=2173173 RepID=A0A2V1HV26_9MICO|nr:DNA-binding response regulator [Amnibacterium flavum]